MTRTVKLLHVLGLTLFLGSILTFIVVSELTKSASLEQLAFARRVISTGTNVLTIPGMWLVTVTGVVLAYASGRMKNPFVLVKATLAAVIVVNAHLFVVPAVDAATAVAQQSANQGALAGDYQAQYSRESIFGGVNVVLVLAAAAIGVWKLRGRPAPS